MDFFSPHRIWRKSVRSIIIRKIRVIRKIRCCSSKAMVLFIKPAGFRTSNAAGLFYKSTRFVQQKHRGCSTKALPSLRPRPSVGCQLGTCVELFPTTIKPRRAMCHPGFSVFQHYKCLYSLRSDCKSERAKPDAGDYSSSSSQLLPLPSRERAVASLAA